MIRRTILFDNKCGFVLGENPKAPNPYVTWQFNEQDGHRDFFWGHYHNEPDMAERDFHNRAEDYQRRYHVFEVEQAPDKETYKYYSTQRPIDIGTYPNSYFNRPVHMDLYFTRQEVTGEAFQAWGAITYAQPLTKREMQDYELRPSRENLDIRRQMDTQAQVVGKWEDAHHVPEQRRLTSVWTVALLTTSGMFFLLFRAILYNLLYIDLQIVIIIYYHINSHSR